MIQFLVTSVVAYVLYLLLTTGSGSLFLWSPAELIIGAILALTTGALTRNMYMKQSLRMLNPKRWALFVVYFIGVFLPAMAKANIDVAYRVITGRINPGIVRISPKLETDASLTMLANSITLTPGTLSVDVDEENNDLYVHWINVRREALTIMPRRCEEVCGAFAEWTRRIAG
ncbi:MAG: Na+/H+ antiporter subunit E [Chloroflexota bacterium]